MRKRKYGSWFTIAHADSWWPGRAGGGEEMGGVRGVKHYMQRVAVQGSPTTITAITNRLSAKCKRKSDQAFILSENILKN